MSESAQGHERILAVGNETFNAEGGRAGTSSAASSRWLARLNQDWITVYEWNPRLYRRVSMSGFVLGFLTAAMLAGLAEVIAWMVSHG